MIKLTEFLEMDFPTTTLESIHTPSYPSGHSTQGIFIGRVLSKMYPKHEKQLMEIGKMISNSRLIFIGKVLSAIIQVILNLVKSWVNYFSEI